MVSIITCKSNFSALSALVDHHHLLRLLWGRVLWTGSIRRQHSLITWCLCSIGDWNDIAVAEFVERCRMQEYARWKTTVLTIVAFLWVLFFQSIAYEQCQCSRIKCRDHHCMSTTGWGVRWRAITSKLGSEVISTLIYLWLLDQPAGTSTSEWHTINI